MDKIETIGFNLIHRQEEVEQYDFNIDNYKSQLEVMTDETWESTGLSQYKNVKLEQLPESLTDEEEDLIVELQQKDRIKKLIRTEKQQRRNAFIALQGLKRQAKNGKISEKEAIKKGEAKKKELEAQSKISS
jgi:hypothetical protein